MVPILERPDPAQFESTLAAATTAALVRDDGRRIALSRADLGALRPLLRAVPEGPRAPGWGAMSRTTIALARHGQPLAEVVVYGDLSLALLSWEAFVAAAAPEALAAWLAAHGADAPLRALERARAPGLGAALAAWRAAAPAEIRADVEAAAADPRIGGDAGRWRKAVDTLIAARGGKAGAIWALATWYGARTGSWREAYGFEAVTDGALRSLGVHEVITAAASGVPAEARAGVARFLVENVTTRGWGLEHRLPEAVRRSLVEAARASGDAENGARAARLLLGEGTTETPAGGVLVAEAQAGTFRRLCTDGVRAFAADGHDLVRIEAGRGAAPVTKLFKPETPLAVHKREVLFLQPGGVERVAVDGDTVKRGRGPLFDLPARRLPGVIDAFVAKRDEVLGRAAPAGADLLVLDPDADAAAAYAAFGGDLPAAVRLGAAYACDVARGVLIEAPWRKPAREVALGGRPVWIGATETGVLVVVARDGSAAIIAVDEGGPARTLGVVQAPAEDVQGVLRVGGGAWMRLWAPLGDVLVALAPA